LSLTVAYTGFDERNFEQTKDMDLLPVELLRAVFEACDPPSVRSLRAVARTLADVGYDYLLPPHITVVWGDEGIERLHSIATHERLKTSIESVSLVVGPWHGKYPGYMEGYRSLDFSSLLRKLGNQLDDALQMLPKLKSVMVDLKDATPPGPSPHIWDTKDMAMEAAINAIVSAASRCSWPSLAFDRFPLQSLSKPDNRAHWFQCAPSFGSYLRRLDLTAEVVEQSRPQSSVRAINGLGRVLRTASNLTHLSLGLVSTPAQRQRLPLDFQELFSDFTFEKLTDLKLAGFACTESELGGFILRHAPTLERLRLGGRTVWRKDPIWGGITLYGGSWRSLFTSLAGKLPQLKRFHIEGMMQNGDMLMYPHLGLHMFEPVTDDTWKPCPNPRSRYPKPLDGRGSGRGREQYGVDCRELELFLLHGGPCPRIMI
jgi:hypothetical protein